MDSCSEPGLKATPYRRQLRQTGRRGSTPASRRRLCSGLRCPPLSGPRSCTLPGEAPWESGLCLQRSGSLLAGAGTARFRSVKGHRARRKAFDLTARFGFFPRFHLFVILPSEHKVSTFLLFLTFPWPWECLALTARDRSLPCCRGHLPPAGEWRLTLVCVTYCLLLTPCPAPGRSG